MVEIHFTRIYIIESLQPGDNLTGIDLYNNLNDNFPTTPPPEIKSNTILDSNLCRKKKKRK